MDIREIIGEATEYDKKEMLERKRPKSWLKSVSAFANGIGGKLFFGINDDGEIVGLADPEKDADDISEIIKSKMDPSLKLISASNKQMMANASSSLTYIQAKKLHITT